MTEERWTIWRCRGCGFEALGDREPPETWGRCAPHKYDPIEVVPASSDSERIRLLREALGRVAIYAEDEREAGRKPDVGTVIRLARSALASDSELERE